MADSKGLIGRLAAAIRPQAAVNSDGVVASYTNFDQNLYRLGGFNSEAGTEVSTQSVLQLDVAWACIRLISETIASLPLNLYIRTSDGRKLASNHQLHYLLSESPNSFSTAYDFWQAVVTAMLLNGNAYVRKVAREGQLESLQFLPNNRLFITSDTKGLKTYTFRKDDATQIEVPRSQIWHIKGYSLDGETGLSAVAYGSQVFGTAIAAERQAARAFRNGTLQSIYYSVAAFLTKEQRKDFSENVMSSVETGRTPILEGGIDVKSLGLNPADAQLLQSRQWSVESICRFFRVPPSAIGHSSAGTTSWGSGIESQMLGFLSYTIAPWLRRIEQAISLGLLSPGERKRYFADYDVKALLRADSAARASYMSTMVNNGLMTRDEARADEGLPRLGGNAAVLTVQSAMVPIDKIGLAQSSPQMDVTKE